MKAPSSALDNNLQTRDSIFFSGKNVRLEAVVFYYLFKWVKHFDRVLNRPSTVNDNATGGVK